MREILFRGKRIDNGEWVEGCFIEQNAIFSKDCASGSLGKSNIGKYYIGIDVYLVDQKTVGQFTGLTDKNGVKIFEGDVLKSDLQSKGYFVVTFEHGSFCTYWTSDFGPNTPMAWTFDEGFTEPFQYFTKFGCVVGNIHDNPELL